jgi:AcrR family transcriptional regulator
MAQILKEAIRKKIYDAALEEFYEKDYKRATIRNMAKRAGISTGLLYSYYKGKADLFEEIVKDVVNAFPNTLKVAEENPSDAYESYKTIEKQGIIRLFERRKEFIILIDKSAGTPHEHARDRIIDLMEEHIRTGMRENAKIDCDPLFFHILADNLFESIIEVMRHFQDREWGIQMLDLIGQQFFKGSESFFKS